MFFLREKERTGGYPVETIQNALEFAMHAGRLVSCIFTSRYRSGLLLGGSRLLKSTELLSPSLFLFFSFLKAGD